MIDLISATKATLFIVVMIFFTTGCTRDTQKIDLLNNDAHKRQAFNQILNNPELQNEFFMELLDNKEAMNRMMQDSDLTGKLFNRENMNYMWEQNPGMDTTVIDNVTTRMHTDTVFMNEFQRRMERGTPTGTSR